MNNASHYKHLCVQKVGNKKGRKKRYSFHLVTVYRRDILHFRAQFEMDI